MNESNELPEELRCFICAMLLTDYKVVGLEIHCADCDLVAGVAVCEDDFAWIKENEDAARALCQSRLTAMLKKENQDDDSGFGDIRT